jgi:hypothetical protein
MPFPSTLFVTLYPPRVARPSPAHPRSNIDPNNPEHKAKLSHELIGGAAGFEAMKAYEQHCAKNGQPPSVSACVMRVAALHLLVLTVSQHAMAKELLAGFAAAEVDRLFETKGECGCGCKHECECSVSENS